jgi:carbon storage regulator
MLVLTRKLGETIVIGDNIVIKVVDIHGKQIRLGIEAPTEISIFRGEIHERIQEENRRAAANNSSDSAKGQNKKEKG